MTDDDRRQKEKGMNAPGNSPQAHTPDEDFARNKSGLYGGVPKVRDPSAPGEGDGSTESRRRPERKPK